MAIVDSRSGRFAATALAAGLVVASCTPTPTPAPTSAPSRAPAEPTFSIPPTGPHPGATIHILAQAEQWNHVDPQRIYTPEDVAFFGATTMRALTAYRVSADPVEGTTLVPDMATDLGTPAEGGRIWSFTIRQGVTWQDGSDVTCEHIKYGVSRSFATDIVNQGPTYAISHLDIPTTEDGSPAYKGPYTGEGQALYDQAVTCDGPTITFNLNKPVVDFNHTVTFGFGAVRESDDTGERFGTVAPKWVPSNGPYQVERYTTGNGGQYVLVRNPNWNQDSDPLRKAYPDRWIVEFALDPRVIDQRLLESEGDDAYALLYGNVQPATLPLLFTDEGAARPAVAGRAINGFDPYVRYYWINVERVTNVKIRQAMMVALDRAAIRALRGANVGGGAFVGSRADGLLKPNIGQDYAPTGIWDTFFGQPVPESGDPDLARRLIQESGEIPAVMTFKFPDTPVNQEMAEVVIESLARAGIVVEADPYCGGFGCGVIFEHEEGDFGSSGWGADWPSASTVIPPLFTMAGGWDLSRVDDPAFNAAVADALGTLDGSERAGKWQALSRRVVEHAWAIPMDFGLSQTLGGTKVAPLYRWPAYSSWPYAEMFVTR